jgi:DNA invertase Pin-like site-specific DNA recombinase
MLIGYARVSTDEQDTRLQIDALKRAGCEKIYEERASGSRTDRPELNKALAHGRKGDVVIVWKLDRLGRSLPHLIDTVHDLEERKVGFRSLTDNIDTTTASGRMFFHMMGALAQFERDLIRERTMAGLKAARERGNIGGRPRKLTDADLKFARSLMRDKSEHWSWPAVATRLGVSHMTLWRAMRREPAELTAAKKPASSQSRRPSSKSSRRSRRVRKTRR